MFKYLAFLLCCVGYSMAFVDPPHIAAVQLKFRNLFLQTRAASPYSSQDELEHTLLCFATYQPILNAHTAEYNRTYNECLEKAQASKTKIDEQSQPQRQEIENSALNSCKIMQDCTKIVGSMDYYTCFERTGSENARTMYNISATAGNNNRAIEEQMITIRSDKYRCTNASTEAYNRNTMATMAAFQNCLNGQAPVPVPTTSAPTTEATTATTKASESPETPESPESPEVPEAPEVPEVPDEDIEQPIKNMLGDSHFPPLLRKFKRQFH